MSWSNWACRGAGLLALAVGSAEAQAQNPDIRLCDEGVSIAQSSLTASVDKYLAACGRALKSAPVGVVAIEGEIRLNRALMRFWRDDMRGAIAEFDPFLARNRRAGLAYRSRFLRQHANLLTQALADNDEWVRLSPAEPIAYFDRGQTHLEMGQIDLAIADYGEALRLAPREGRIYIARAYAWKRKDDLGRALADVNEAIRLKPLEASLYLDRGDIKKEVGGDIDGALQDYSEARKIDPKNVDVLLRRGNLWLYDKDDPAKALADYNEASRLSPASPTAPTNRGSLYLRLGEYEKALREFDAAIKLNARYALGYSGRGAAWRMQGDINRSLADLDTAIDLEPRGPIYYTNRGDTWRYVGDIPRAIADFDAALRLHPDFVHALVGRGLAYEKAGDLAKAKVDFRKAIAVPKHKYWDARDKQEAARARLAALESGAPLPKIPAVPGKATSNTSLPTPKVALSDVKPDAVRLTQSREGRRAALVIGNSSYANTGALANPQRDAQAVSAALQKIGFDVVTLASDATREKLLETLRTFANEADKADWALVYYAGHGIEVSGINYLIPIEAKLKTDRDVQFEAVPLDQVMAAVEGAKKLRVVVLDACRDNPFLPQTRTVAIERVAALPSAGRATGARSIGRGLGEVKVSGATLVVYAAKHGQTALDGEGENSPFAVALLQRIATPGIEINKLFRLIRDDVMEATAGRQEPFTYGSLPGRDFFFLAAN